MGVRRLVEKILLRLRRKLTKGLYWDSGSGINGKV